MDAGGRGERLRTFVIGGLVGASAVLAAVRRRRHDSQQRLLHAGLGAFEDAPCYRELLELERSEEPDRRA